MSGSALNPSSRVGAPRAFVLGVNGQDGSYLAESLVARGWNVCGLARQSAPAAFLDPRIEYLGHDLADVAGYEKHLQRLAPDAVFHAAAVHGPAGFDYEKVWKQAHLVNTLCAHATLEYARQKNPALRFFYFSSSKVFGDLHGRTLCEDAPRVSSCIYSATKNCATDLVRHYRERFGVPAATLWFFHHESPRRAPGYFIPTMVAHLARARADRDYRAKVHSLGFWSDWGDAREYMQMLAEITERAPGRDLIFATGRSVWARRLVEELFARHGLNFRDHLLEESPQNSRPEDEWRVDISQLAHACGYAPSRSLLDTCDDLLTAPRVPASSEVAL